MSEVTKESSLYARVASGGRDSIEPCISMLRTFGYDAPQSRQELAYMLADCAINNGDKVFETIALNHPDKDFILENITPSELAIAKKNNSLAVVATSNDCGCTSCVAKRNDTGNSPATIMPAPGTSAIQNASSPDFTSSPAFFMLVAMLIMSSTVVFSIIVSKVLSNGTGR
jgi:hypothetical protein